MTYKNNVFLTILLMLGIFFMTLYLLNLHSFNFIMNLIFTYNINNFNVAQTFYSLLSA